MEKQHIKISWLLCVLLCSLLSATCAAKTLPKKRLLLLISYHQGYTWSDNIKNTIIEHVNSQAPNEVEIKIIYMDTKRNESEVFKRQAGFKVKELIDVWKPDVIIGCDDNAAKYVAVPYVLNSNIPFVFCGLNEDPANYGFPGKNVTGIREVSLISPLYNHLLNYSQGNRIGYLTPDKDTQRVMAMDAEKQIGKKFDAIYFVKDTKEWKEYFLRLQDEVDILLMIDCSILPDWDKKEAFAFIYENIKIPSGATSELSQEEVLLCISKSAKEHGIWAAEAALKILKGAKPKDIPITINKKGLVSLNFVLADKLRIIFNPSLLRAAETIVEK